MMHFSLSASFSVLLKDRLSAMSKCNPVVYFICVFQRDKKACSCLRELNKGWKFAVPPTCNAGEVRAQLGVGKRHETSFKIEVVQSESMLEEKKKQLVLASVRADASSLCVILPKQESDDAMWGDSKEHSSILNG